jgi:uncharacterized protein YaaR (DUF327 family)
MSTWLQKFNEWESHLRTSDREKQSISMLSAVCLDQVAQVKPKRKSTDLTPAKQQETVVIETTQQFLSFFSDIEKEMNQGQDAKFNDYLDSVEQLRTFVERLIEEIRTAKEIVGELQENHEFVVKKTSGLQNACESLLDEQAHMFAISEEISQKLSYFHQLESISKLLNMPGDHLVLEPEFGPMLEKLDQCLAFVTDHPSFKDSDLYRMRYRQCMTRSMTLIKLYFVDAIRQLQTEIRDKLKLQTGAEAISNNVQLSLFFVKFRALASRTRGLLSELEMRCASHQEYFALLRDCINAYVKVRKTFLTPIISENVKKKVLEGNGVQFAVNICTYMLSICKDEYTLFKEFFSLGNAEIKNYLESFSGILTSTLRPIILKEHRVDVLSDLCNQLLFMMNSKVNDDETLEPVEFVIENILHDAQNRLSFRAQDIIQNEIRSFKPREAELSILARGPGLPQPLAVSSVVGVADVLESEVLPHRRSSVVLSPSIEAALDPKDVSHHSMENLFGGGEWYPTVQRTVSLLSKLHGCLPQASFDDLAQDAIESCRVSVMAAKEMIKVQMTPADGQLFAIKNLMQLREHISLYDSNFTRSTRNLHFSDIMTAVKDVLVRPLVLQNYGNLVMPFFQTQEDDVRQLLDADLKRSCENFVLDQAKLNSQPLIHFLDTIGKKASHGIDNQYAGLFMLMIDSVRKAYQEFLPAIQKHFPNTIKMMKNYLGDKSTQLTLIRIIRVTAFYRRVQF